MLNTMFLGEVKSKPNLHTLLHFSVGKFDSPEEEEEIKDSCFKDLDWLMVLLGGGGGGGGGRIKTSTRQEKIKLLTLVQESLTC